MIAKDGVRPSERSGVGTGTARGIAAVVGAVAVAGAGTLAWNGGAIGGLRGVGYESPFGMALFGFLIGAGAFFAPCAFVMFPAYVSYYVSLGGAASVTESRLVWRAQPAPSRSSLRSLQ